MAAIRAVSVSKIPTRLFIVVSSHVWVVAEGGDPRGTYQPQAHPKILFEFAKLGRPNPDGSDTEDAAILEFVHRWGLLGRDAVPEKNRFSEFIYGSPPAPSQAEPVDWIHDRARRAYALLRLIYDIAAHQRYTRDQFEEATGKPWPEHLSDNWSTRLEDGIAAALSPLVSDIPHEVHRDGVGLTVMVPIQAVYYHLVSAMSGTVKIAVCTADDCGHMFWANHKTRLACPAPVGPLEVPDPDKRPPQSKCAARLRQRRRRRRFG